MVNKLFMFLKTSTPHIMFPFLISSFKKCIIYYIRLLISKFFINKHHIQHQLQILLLTILTPAKYSIEYSIENPTN